MSLFLMGQWVGLLCVIVFFPDHIHFYLFGSGLVVHVMWYNFVLCKIVLILKKTCFSFLDGGVAFITTYSFCESMFIYSYFYNINKSLTTKLLKQGLIN